MKNQMIKKSILEAIQNLPENAKWEEILSAAQIAAAKSLPPEVIQRATDVFEDETNALHWLATPILALGSLAPVDFIDSENGQQEILNVLVRIEHGIIG